MQRNLVWRKVYTILGPSWASLSEGLFLQNRTRVGETAQNLFHSNAWNIFYINSHFYTGKCIYPSPPTNFKVVLVFMNSGCTKTATRAAQAKPGAEGHRAVTNDASSALRSPEPSYRKAWKWHLKATLQLSLVKPVPSRQIKELTCSGGHTFLLKASVPDLYLTIFKYMYPNVVWLQRMTTI